MPTGMRWAYAVTTIPERAPIYKGTLESLASAGFPDPDIYVDGFAKSQKVGAYGAWVLTAWELYLRHSFVDRYVLFQDDLVACKGLKEYLERIPYPSHTYFNLYTSPANQALAPGVNCWYPSNQKGNGALALMFSREALVAVLGSTQLARGPMNENSNRAKNVDGVIGRAMAASSYREYVSNPSLVQHMGEQSTIGNGGVRQASSFPGESFNCKSLRVHLFG